MTTGRILIVDDDMFVRNSLRRTLMQHEVTMAEDGREAIELIETRANLDCGERFDVILCDLMMPGVTGMDLYAHLKEHAPGYEERMVFLTGGAVDGETNEFMRSVPNPVLEKPFNFQRLRDAITRILED
jgi:CheY-like chemotaxis protein